MMSSLTAGNTQFILFMVSNSGSRMLNKSDFVYIDQANFSEKNLLTLIFLTIHIMNIKEEKMKIIIRKCWYLRIFL